MNRMKMKVPRARPSSWYGVVSCLRSSVFGMDSAARESIISHAYSSLIIAGPDNPQHHEPLLQDIVFFYSSLLSSSWSWPTQAAQLTAFYQSYKTLLKFYYVFFHSFFFFIISLLLLLIIIIINDRKIEIHVETVRCDCDWYIRYGIWCHLHLLLHCPGEQYDPLRWNKSVLGVKRLCCCDRSSCGCRCLGTEAWRFNWQL